MNKYTKLLKNSGIFAIANLGSHLISFLLVRFYTELLTAEQYGMIDFMVTTTSMLIPFLTIAIVEAVLRFSIDSTRKQDVFVNGLVISLVGSILFAVLGPWFFLNTQYKHYFIWMALLILATSVDSICAQYVRGSGKVTAFATSGVLKTFVIVTSNIILLLGLHLKIEGYLLSLILAEVASILYLTVRAKLWKDITTKINRPLLKEMASYSLPLMPNSLSWWVMNAADKYVILLYLGTAANGLYAVAHKVPTLINICNTLFFQAWQLSAVEESKSQSKSIFYSDVFNVLALALFGVCNILMLLLKPILTVLVSDTYGDVWKYTPFLILAMVFSAFSGFLGTNYVAMKKTNGALKTTIAGAGVNIVLNFLLINRLGINGAALATMISFAVTWLYRVYDTRLFVQIRYRAVPLTISIVVLIVQAILVISDSAWTIPVGILALLAIVISYLNEIKIIFGMIKKVFVRLKKKN